MQSVFGLDCQVRLTSRSKHLPGYSSQALSGLQEPSLAYFEHIESDFQPFGR